MKDERYDKYPEVRVKGFDNHAWRGWSVVQRAVAECLPKQHKTVLVIDCYPGVRLDELHQQLICGLNPALIINAETARHSEESLHDLLADNLTDDRVFGVLSCHQLPAFFCPDRLAALQREVEAVTAGLVVVYGPGAALVHPGDRLIYADLARWEIQQRFRSGEAGNWGANNQQEDILRRYKRAFFIEWRVFDRHKTPLLRRADFLLDTNQQNDPALVSGVALRHGLEQTVQQPFRVVPFFDPGVWGGQWMKDKFNLDASQPNYAWGFDCVPEENSLLLRFGDVRLEIPSQDLVLLYPRPLLGEKVHARFGAEFPIRFDFLDTVGGQNLSFQVHPLTEYIQQHFGMHYTQDESYYLLVVDLRALGWHQEKVEGLALIDNKTLAVINDNDFGIRAELTDAVSGKDKMDDYTTDGKGHLLVNGEAVKTKIAVRPLDKPENENELWIISLPEAL